MRKTALRYLFIILGFLFVFLGLLGVILPLLPTTPFLILALACFSRSSTRFHNLLRNAPYVGEDLRNWEKEKKIDKKRKKHIYLIIIISFSISIMVLYGRPWLQLMLFSMMWVLLYFIYGIDEKE